MSQNLSFAAVVISALMVNLQDSSHENVITSRMENSVDPDQLAFFFRGQLILIHTAILHSK